MPRSVRPRKQRIYFNMFQLEFLAALAIYPIWV